MSGLGRRSAENHNDRKGSRGLRFKGLSEWVKGNDKGVCFLIVRTSTLDSSNP
jgi:hypothetical protein